MSGSYKCKFPLIEALKNNNYQAYITISSTNKAQQDKKKGVPSAVGFPHCAGSEEGLFFKPQALPTQMCRDWGYSTTG